MLIEKYVDTGAAGGGDGSSGSPYQSLSQCEVAEDGVYGNLAGDGNSFTVHCDRTGTGGQDTTGVDFGTDWIDDSDSYVTIIADDFPADGVLDTSKYILHTTNGHAFINRMRYSRLVNLQVEVTQNDNGDDRGIYYVSTPSGGSDNRIDSCIIHGICSGTGDCFGIGSIDADCTLKVSNTIIYGFLSSDNPSDGGFRGVAASNSTAVSLYNCTISNCYFGFHDGGATTAAYNCAVFNNADDFYSIDTLSYCACDDADAHTGRVDISPGATEADDWNAAFTDYANGDFSVKDTDSVLYHAGTDLDLATDIIGTAWHATTPSIGAFELPEEAGGSLLLHPGMAGGMRELVGGISA